MKNVDSHEHTVNEASFKIKTLDNHVYGPGIVVTEGSGFKAINLSAGEVTDGNVVFELPQGVEVGELRYDNGFGSDDLFWRRWRGRCRWSSALHTRSQRATSMTRCLRTPSCLAPIVRSIHECRTERCW
ncbi:MAG TPA: DUF4352 domain-containing protein [Dehalococcoidia bacterium]